MASRFPIVSGPQELGIAPSTAVRAVDIDVRGTASTTGAALGQAGIEVTETVKLLLDKRQDMSDTRNASEAQSLFQAALDRQTIFQAKELDTEKWLPNFNKEVNEATSEIDSLPLSPDGKLAVTAKIRMLYRSAAGGVLIDMTTRDLQDTRIKAVSDLVAALSSTDIGIRTAGAGTFTRASKTLWKPAEAIDILRTAFKAGMVERRKQAITAESTSGFDAWQATVTPATPDGDLLAAFDSIEASDLDAGQKQDAESDVRLRVQSRRAENQENLDIRREADLNSINKFIYFDRNYAAAKLAIEASALSEADQGVLFREVETRAKAFADGTKIVNDRVEEARLFEQSLNIWKNTITKKEFDEDLRINAHKLDDAAYRRVSTSATTTLKSSQAEAISTAVSEVKNLIVDFVSEDAMSRFISDAGKGLSPNALSLFEDKTNDERHLQFWSVSQFAGDLRDWLARNPDKLGKDFYTYANARKHVYWNKSIADVRKSRLKQSGVPVPTQEPLIEGEIFPTPAKKPLIEGELEIEGVAKARKPSLRITMQSPSGGAATVLLSGIGKKLDQGFKFPIGSNTRIKKNAGSNAVTFEGISIKPGKRVISLDGGKTWQLLP